MKRIKLFIYFFFCSSFIQSQDFTLDQIKSYPFPNELTGSSNTSRIAWAFDEQGKRNIYVAEGKDFIPRRLTSYMVDDGQELSSVSISPDGKWVVYIRGGDFGSNWGDEDPVNPTFNPNLPKVQIWAVPFIGGNPILIGEGIDPVISSRSNIIAFVKSGQIWTAPIDGSFKEKKLFHSRGNNSSPKWSPDGKKLAFRSNRGDHSFIGIYKNNEKPIVWMDPSYDRDSSPRWSPDGKNLVFIRQPGSGGVPDSILAGRHNPWKILKANTESGESKLLWEAPKTLRGSVPRTHGGTNLHWGNGRIVFLSYHDGWPHLYSLLEEGGKEILLTPGNFMCEYIKISPDRNHIIFTANTGIDPLDIDRRHVIMVPVDKAEMEVMTPGSGLEWTPLITGDMSNLVYLSTSATRPPLPTIMNLKTRKNKILSLDKIPNDFPSDKMVVPTQVVFNSIDGLSIHATKFEKKEGKQKKPAIIYIHGGPPRQMLLGWHYSSYYSNAYALNQYLANLGFVVLSVNYRLGIGYGYEFHNPLDGRTRGASEYKDIKAAGLWLVDQKYIDPNHIYVYGGSYGGFLTAMALGRDSKLFAGGVDIHGVHDWTRRSFSLSSNRYEKAPDYEKAREVAWESSPVSSVSCS